MVAAVTASLVLGGSVPARAAEDGGTSPTVRYDFEGTLADGSGHGNDAIARDGAAPEYADGVNGQSLSVTRGRNFVSLPSSVQAGSDGMTVSFWYRQTARSSDGAIFSNQDWRSGTNPGVTLSNQSGDTDLWVSYNGSRQTDTFDLATGTIAGLPGWNHLTFVIDRATQTQTVYRNGTVVNSVASGNRSLTSPYPFRLGSDGSGTVMDAYPNTWITGLFDDVRFYDRPLSADDVLAGFEEVLPSGATEPQPEPAQCTPQDGIRLENGAGTDFDELADRLQPAADESIPAETLGFTHTAPDGWSVETDASMDGLGVEEWRGWSFATVPFWSSADSQHRDAFTRGSGVVAIADPDEWDDKGSPTSSTRFTSSLVSPVWDITGLTALNLGFESHYRPSAPQTAQVLVSYDGCAPVEVVRWDAPVSADDGSLENQALVVPLDVPEGASTVQVTFKLGNAGNDWYWAIDDVRLSTEAIDYGPAPEPTAPVLTLPDSPNGVSAKKALVIGVDGMAWDQIQQFDTPNFDAIQAAGLAGTSYLYAPDYAATVSLPGWANIATGVWPDKHGFVANAPGGDFARYPDFLTRLERSNPSLSTLAIGDWDWLFTQGVFSDEIDVLAPVQPVPTWDLSAEAETVAMADRLATQNPDAAFVYYGVADANGHESGRESPAYRDAIEHTDERIGRLLAAVRSRPTYADEDWLVMVVPDHGFVGTGHGGASLDERRVWVYAMGGDIPNQVVAERDPEPVDIAPTVLAHFGVPLDPAFDGVPIGSTSTDPFDTMKPALRGAADETGPGAEFLGWTHETPDGWSIDNTAMGAGGSTEWRGWSLTSDVFWTGTNQGERREYFVRGRDVWAVADPDAWAEQPSKGGFDSTISSGAFDVRGLDEVSASFLTRYRAAEGQTATVSVSFDGGAPVEVLALDSDVVSERLTARVAVPEGATTMTVLWRLAAPSAGWYWAIDDPQVSAPLFVEPESPAWERTTTYQAGATVSHESAEWVAQWWTRDQAPGDPYGPWAELGTLEPAAGDGVRAWTASWIYTGGETVAYNGRLWAAKWWTRNQVPGDPNGPWRDLGQLLR